MANKESPPKLLKKCFGTKEWSENSGICGNCSLKNDCGNSMRHAKGSFNIIREE